MMLALDFLSHFVSSTESEGLTPLYKWILVDVSYFFLLLKESANIITCLFMSMIQKFSRERWRVMFCLSDDYLRLFFEILSLVLVHTTLISRVKDHSERIWSSKSKTTAEIIMFFEYHVLGSGA